MRLRAKDVFQVPVFQHGRRDAGGDPHEFYETYIAPYKGELEVWYQDNLTFMTDFKIIFLTAWVILFPESKLMETWFKDLPALPEALKI